MSAGPPRATKKNSSESNIFKSFLLYFHCKNNAYLNFISTHDGIGFRPLEGILPEEEIGKYISFLKNQGALLTYRKDKKKESVYEVNITLLNSLQETYDGKDKFDMERFILAHAILFSVEGIPAIYIQNLLGSKK